MKFSLVKYNSYNYSKHLYKIPPDLTMLRPFQCLLGCLVENAGFLLAASGSCIYSFDLSHGSLLSTWPPPEQTQSILSETLNPVTQLGDEHSASKDEPEILGRASKRRKNSPLTEVPEIISAKAIPKAVNGDNSESKKSRVSCSAVIKLAGPTKDQHVVAVTEDKCIRVLQLSKTGVLTLLSERWVIFYVYSTAYSLILPIERCQRGLVL